MLQQIDHVNLVVHDLAAMVRFYCDVLGLHETRRVTINGDWIGRVVGIDDVVADVVYLELPDGPRIELLRYESPAAEHAEGMGRPHMRGLRHLAFRVDDIDAAVAKFRRLGVRFIGEVQRVPDTQVTYAGGVRKRLVYFHDPEQNLLELCEYREARRP